MGLCDGPLQGPAGPAARDLLPAPPLNRPPLIGDLHSPLHIDLMIS